MPQTRIEIEELGPGRWVAEIEAGGTTAVRRHVTGATFDDIILAVVDTRAELTPVPAVRPVREVLADQAARETAALVAAEEAALAAVAADDATMHADDAAFAEAHAVAESERRVGEAEGGEAPDRAELIAEAEGMGLSIDRRWGDVRLREVVEAERARRAATSP